jgi:3-hydroxybutyryl-CoA dehydrogenase
MKQEILKVGIVGEGKMGAGIFNYLLDYPFEQVWICSREADLEKILRQFRKKVNRSLDAGIMNPERYNQLKSTIISSDPGDLNDCDLVIEAIPESVVLKRDFFAGIDPHVKPEALFTSNSSSINPSEITPESDRSGRFAGLHFFYPVPFKNIAEITLSPLTTLQTTSAIENFLNIINRRFITLDEKNSFFLNRIFLVVQNEVFLMVKGGRCSVAQADQMVKDHLFPFGVFDFCDSVGIDTMLASIRNYTRDYPHRDYFAVMINMLQYLESQGRLGMKTRAGFYSYPLPEEIIAEPANASEMIHYLRQTWLSSCKRVTAMAHLPLDDANEAIKEYFGLQAGPFE